MSSSSSTSSDVSSASQKGTVSPTAVPSSTTASATMPQPAATMTPAPGNQTLQPQQAAAPPSPPRPSPTSPPKPASSSSDDEEMKWNNIIPAVSHSIPNGNRVAPRPGSGRAVWPTPNDQQPSPQQGEDRVWGLRQVLGEPVGVTNQEITGALEAEGWDMGAALRRINGMLNDAHRRHAMNKPKQRTPAERQRDRVLGADSLHHNRRLGLDLLYTRLAAPGVVDAQYHNQLTTLTLGNLLADNSFDIDTAVNAFLERTRDSNEMAEHDRRHRRQRAPDPANQHQDYRTARFMEITGTDDFWAARMLLRQHNYDMGLAMDQWMRNGLPFAQIPPRDMMRTQFRRPVQIHTDFENLWPYPRPLAGRVPNLDTSDTNNVAEGYGDNPNSARAGFFIRYPRREARLGVHVPTRQSCAYIKGKKQGEGDYVVCDLNDVKAKDGSRTRVPFNYNDSNHVQHLNSLASQWMRRIVGEKKKERGAFYQKDENEWLWWYHNERLWDLLENNPGLLHATTAGDFARAGVQWPITMDMGQLRNDYNNHWTPQGRSFRDIRSLDAQRRRIEDLCRDFGLPFSPPHPKKTPAKRAYSSSGSDKDSNGDGDGKPDAGKDKRRK